jgi:hypothetical protein
MQPATYRGEQIVLLFREGADGAKLYDVLRLEAADGEVARIVDYYFCPDTLALVGEGLGLAVETAGYHQGPDILPRMVATTTLPWGEGMKLH